MTSINLMNEDLWPGRIRTNARFHVPGLHRYENQRVTDEAWAGRCAAWRAVAIVIGAMLFGNLPAHSDDALPRGTAELRAVAGKGDAVAQFCLGNRYYSERQNDPARDAEAQKWFRLSAAQGNAQAEERLGELYFAGRGEAQDYGEAAAWFRKAAAQGNRAAQRRLAEMYREGKGVPADPYEAQRWNELASSSAAPTPCYAAKDSSFTTADGTALRDFPDLRRQAQQGNADAQFQLGERYYDERVRDPAKDAEAQKWLRMAAAQGNGRAEDRLGWIYYRGNGVPQDYVQAANWYRRAAEHGNLDAMTRLGNMYRTGEGVPRDPEEGRKWINKASEIGTRPARIREYRWLAGLLAGIVAFAGSLKLMQRNTIFGWRRVVLAAFVHVIGAALVLNTLNTYGLPELLFPKCSYGYLAASCQAYQNPTVRHLATQLRDWQTLNLIWRFMAMVGFIFDALGIWYVVYLRQLWRPRRAHLTGQ
jgi:TPR repeat protein